MKKRTFLYEFFKLFFSIAHRLFYKEIIVEGRENIPKTGALIFAPNHQNALMDAFAVIFTNIRMVIFLARADIFKNNFIAWILYGLKILPVYRQRDGKDSLQKNEEIFNKTIEILEYKSSMCLFPETQHTDKRRLQQLKKGVQRIALQAEEKNKFSLDIKIVPVGIYYSDYTSSRSILQIKYGKPINVSDYFNIYKENDQKAMLAIRDELTARIKPLIIDIQNPDYYDMYEYLREIYFKNILEKRKLKNNQKNKFIADKIIIESLDVYAQNHNEEMSKLNIEVSNYEEQLNKKKLQDKVIVKPKKSFLILFLKTLVISVLSPVFLYVYIINFIPYYLPKKVIKNIKDRQFHSSFKFGIGLLFFPVYYFIIICLIFIFSKFTYFNICFSVTLWFTLYIYFKFREVYNHIILNWRFFKLKINNPQKLNELIEIRKDIIKKMEGIVKI